MIGIIRTLHADLQIPFRLFMVGFLDDGHYCTSGKENKTFGFSSE
jgi:hypothetical protein